MSELSFFIQRRGIIILFLFLITGNSCKEKDKNDLSPENWLEHSYAGVLTVRYTSVYPEWDVSAQMDVIIDKELGAVQVESGNLYYSGETVMDEDAKIERTGNWELYPNGWLENPDDPYVHIDAGVVVQNDVQKIYAKDNRGNWQLVSTIDFSGSEPNADLSFNLDQSLLGGAIINDVTSAGSLVWTLNLTVGLD